jgi:hypothetical protein
VTISLASLKPQAVDVKVMGNGEPLTIPALPLSYIQWQNATIGLTPPKIRTKRIVPDISKAPVDVPDPDNPDYQRDDIEYKNAIKLRRIAMALAGAGMPELQDKTLDEQVELIRDMDAGIMNALYIVLEGLATKRMGAWFRRSPGQTPDVPGASNGHLQANGLGVGAVAET